MKELEVRGVTGTSRIVVGGSIDGVGAYCRPSVVVTDAIVQKLHGKSFPNVPVIEVGVGEESKTLETVEKVYGEFLRLEIDRQSFVLAIGGGIVCDVAGFAASTFMRGTRFGFVPTTLLAMVDASVGGKNGVNFQGFKNMVGVFKQPKVVLCDFRLLETLPARELRSGFAEVVKCGAIADAGLFEFLEGSYEKVLSLDGSAVEKAVCNALEVKTAIVGMDEVERGGRMKLNFGHTVGHGVEVVKGIPHGEAVSIGMVAEARLSVKKGLLEESKVERVEALLKKSGLPVNIRLSAGEEEEVLSAIAKDKKSSAGVTRVVALREVGSACVVEASKDEIRGVLRGLRG